MPMTEEFYPDGYFIFYQDNAAPHKGKKITEWMTKHIPYFPDVPPYSCDLNPIENIWSILKTQVQKRQPKDMDQLKIMIEEEWDEQTVLKNCINNCRKRLKEVYEENFLK